MQGACISHLERRDGFYSALLSTDTIGRVTAGSTNPRDRSLRPTREGTLQVELVEQRFSLYRPWHGMHRLSVTQRNRLTSVRGLPSAFGAYVYTVILAQQVKTGKENGDVLSHKTSSHLRATDLPHAPCVQEAIPPPHECRGSPCQLLMNRFILVGLPSLHRYIGNYQYIQRLILARAVSSKSAPLRCAP